MAGQVLLDINGPTATITLDQPDRLNAISRDMWGGLLDAASTIESTSDIRVAVIRGAGSAAFAAGADISQFKEQRADGSANTAYDATTDAATRALLGLSVPLVAAIHGFCLGGGLAVALSADIRISADDGRFAIPAARLGLGYGLGGVAALVALVGPANAKRILFTAHRFTAPEAASMGLIQEVVPKDDLDRRVSEIVGQIANNAPLTIAAVKLAVRELGRPQDRQDLASVDAAVRACFDSSDYREGVAAFGEKRQPRFTGS